MQERLQLSTAVFNVEKRNVARNLGGGVYEQIGKVRARGFEAEVAGLVTSAWHLTRGYRSPTRRSLTTSRVPAPASTFPATRRGARPNTR